MASGDRMAFFGPLNNEPPIASAAQIEKRNAHPALAFDGSADEEAVFTDKLLSSYSGGGLSVITTWALKTATSGSLRVQVAIERMDLSSLSLDADSFAAFQSAGGAAPGTSGLFIEIPVAFTAGAQMDGLLASEMYRLKIRRDADGTSGTDDITTDAQLLGIEVKET
jgi:hypothetical protein